MFDSHAHVAFYQFDDDREEIIARAREAGLTGWLEVGTNLEQSRKSMALAEQEAGVLATVGVHPSDVAQMDDKAWIEVEELLKHEKVAAVGEVGFDFYHQDNELEQHAAVIRFIELAQERGLPMVWHVRSGKDKDAHELLISVLSDLPDLERPMGVVHTYSGNSKQAEQYLKLGMYLSFSGVVTFKNAGEIAEVAKGMPLDRMLIETDCPFLAPEPYRGKRNEPAYVKFVAEKIAELRGIEMVEVEQATDENVKQLFRAI